MKKQNFNKRVCCNSLQCPKTEFYFMGDVIKTKDGNVTIKDVTFRACGSLTDVVFMRNLHNILLGFMFFVIEFRPTSKNILQSRNRKVAMLNFRYRDLPVAAPTWIIRNSLKRVLPRAKLRYTKAEQIAAFPGYAEDSPGEFFAPRRQHRTTRNLTPD